MGPWRSRAASPGVCSCTKPRAVNNSRRSVIGAYRTRWKRAPQPASLRDMARRQLSVLQRVWHSSRARRVVLVSFLAVLAFGLAVLTALWTRACAGNSCPSIAELGGYDPNQASKVYAADGRLITDLGLERRTVVPLGEMSPYVKAAFITTEDKRFYEHHGIDWYRVLGAIKNNITKFRVAEGFSTITMQLARNLWPEDISGRDKTLSRKLRRLTWPARSRPSIPRTRSSSCTSTRSTSGTAPTA